jgi:hypothetical protein
MTIKMIRIRMIQETTMKRPKKPTRLSGRPAPVLGKIGKLERPPGLGKTPVRGNGRPCLLPFSRSYLGLPRYADNCVNCLVAIVMVVAIALITMVIAGYMHALTLRA